MSLQRGQSGGPETHLDLRITGLFGVLPGLEHPVFDLLGVVRAVEGVDLVGPDALVPAPRGIEAVGGLGGGVEDVTEPWDHVAEHAATVEITLTVISQQLFSCQL